MGVFHPGDRVLVRWTRAARGELTTYAGRVLEIKGDNARDGQFVPLEARVVYECDGLRLWHPLSELSLLDEDALVALPPDSEVEIVAAPWHMLSLKCCYSLSPLTDPARSSACTHPARCNFDALHMCLQSGSRACPVSGCSVTNIRSRDVVRDVALRAALAGLPPDTESSGQVETLSPGSGCAGRPRFGSRHRREGPTSRHRRRRGPVGVGAWNSSTTSDPCGSGVKPLGTWRGQLHSGRVEHSPCVGSSERSGQTRRLKKRWHRPWQ